METASPTTFDRMAQMISGFEVSQAIYVVVKLGVIEKLAGDPRPVSEIAPEVGAQPDALFRVMRFLASQGVLTQDGEDRFGLTPLGATLAPATPGSLGPLSLLLNEEIYRASGELLHTVRTGETGFQHVYGVGQFEYLATHPEANATFNEAMVSRRASWEFLLPLFDFERHKLLVDVGGGRGTVLATLLKANRRLNGLLFDLPHVMAEADAYLSRQGVRDRARLLGGSILDFAPADADLYLEVSVFHLFPDPLALKALENIRRGAEPDAALLLVEQVVPPGAVPHHSKQMDVRMLYGAGGRERSEGEWRALIERAGLKLEQVLTTGDALSMLIVRIPPDR